jgi:succinate-semialdehyde dehydrogenase/glutarate-semialdehyde dehydrogenase
MATTGKRRTATRAKAQSLRSFDPRTGSVLEEIPANAPDDVREAVARARAAQPAWAALSVRERAAALGEVRLEIGRRMDDLIDTIHRENGKPRAEAVSHDVLPTVFTIAYLERVAPRALRPQPAGRLIAPLLGLSSRIEWRPFGVVGCISPWNYPLLLSFMGLVPALLAGNTVVLKPSEMTPATGERIREVLTVLPSNVATVVLGGGDVGAALVDAPCDKLCFIGSTATGRRIAAAAAEHLTPTVMELGGQDAAIVCEDADLDVASSGVLWGSLLNAGQTCCAIERAYVSERIADEFERRLVDKAGRLRRGEDVGPLTVQRQFDVVRRHVDDAVAQGATTLAGGDARSDSDDGFWFDPTILEGRTEDMALYGEETFGPVLPIVRVTDDDEAVRRANQEGFNLTASVWSSSRDRAERIASRLVAGTVTINDHALTAGTPWGMWGGVGQSGYGRLHGKLGLREFAVPVHVARNLLPRMKRPWWFPYDLDTTDGLRAAAELLTAPSPDAAARAGRRMLASLGRAVRAKI